MKLKVGDVFVCDDGREFRLTMVTEDRVAYEDDHRIGSGSEPRDIFERGVTSGEHRWMKRDIDRTVAHLKYENGRLRAELEKLRGEAARLRGEETE